jgi:hypothetical protein
MKRKIDYIVSCILFFIVSSACLQSQEDSARIQNKNLRMKNPEGTEFWLCFEKNYRDTKTPSDSLMLELFITGDVSSNVNIEIDGINYKNSFYVQGGTIKNIKIPAEAEVKSEEVVERLAIHITSDKPVSVYGLNRRKQTTDTYLGFSTEVLGTEYRALCYTISDGLMPQLAIVATEDGTEVEITPAVTTTKHAARKAYTVNLKKGDVFQVVARDLMSSRTDLTGTYIKSNKKIAVFSGHQCAYVPPKEIACNHLVEQMPPIPSWGKHFYIGRLQPRLRYTYRVLANEDETRVFEDNKLVRILNAGEYYESIGDHNIQVTASKPVLVAEYSQGFKSGDMIGDPMMLLISPTQQFLRQYRFATPINGSWKHYVNVVVPTQAINSIKLDGFPVDTSRFETLGLSRYSIGYIPVEFGSHLLEGSMPFGMYSYGFGYDKDAFDAYGTMGGQSFMEYEQQQDTLPPLMEERPGANVLNMIFRDDRVDDSGIKGIRVVENIGLALTMPEKIEEGLPQLSVLVKPLRVSSESRMVVEASDVAGNSSVYTVCYTYNARAGRFVFIVNEGRVEGCFPEQGYLLGAFGKVSVAFHTADFSSSGNVHAMGNFSQASAVSGYAGFSLTRFIKPSIALSGRLTFENFNGTLEAPDTLTSFARGSNGSLVQIREGRSLSLNAVFVTLSAAAEYYFETYFYGLGGVSLSIPLSKSIDYSRGILSPSGYTYSNGSRQLKEQEATLSSLSFLGLNVFAGLGFTYPVSNDLSVFAESIYSQRLNSMISDGSWHLSQISFQAGINIRF